MMLLKVGSKVKFAAEKRPYTVQAADERFAVCTKPFNVYRSVLYTIIDFKENVRGAENLLFGAGAETREQCEDMLDRLNGRHDSNDRTLIAAGQKATADHTEVSYRNRIDLDIERVFDEAPSRHARRCQDEWRVNMKCKCGRTMGWTWTGPINLPHELHDIRVYHCPKCGKDRDKCDCRPLVAQWDIEAMTLPGWTPYRQRRDAH